MVCPIRQDVSHETNISRTGHRSLKKIKRRDSCGLNKNVIKVSNIAFKNLVIG